MEDNKSKIESEQCKIAIQALKDIIDPVSLLKSKLKEGETLNGMYVIKLLDDPSFYQRIALKALKEINLKDIENYGTY